MTCYKHRYCVKHAEQLLQLLEETQPTSITSCNTTIKTYTNNSKLTLAIVQLIICKLQYLFIKASYTVIAILNSVIAHRKFSSCHAGLANMFVFISCQYTVLNAHISDSDSSVIKNMAVFLLCV